SRGARDREQGPRYRRVDLVRWRLPPQHLPELLESVGAERVSQLDLTDIEDVQGAAGRRLAAALRCVQAHLVDPQSAVRDRDGERAAEERLQIEAWAGGGDAHRLEDAPPRGIEEDAAVVAHLRADAPARREVRVRDLGVLEPGVDVVLLARVHGALDEVG